MQSSDCMEDSNPDPQAEASPRLSPGPRRPSHLLLDQLLFLWPQAATLQIQAPCKAPGLAGVVVEVWRGMGAGSFFPAWVLTLLFTNLAISVANQLLYIKPHVGPGLV